MQNINQNTIIMRKILSLFTAVLVALAVNAQTIAIDGSNADWADVPMLTEPGESPILKMVVPQAGLTLPDGGAYCLMVEGNHPQIVAGYPVIYTDADKNPATGAIPWFCSTMGYDYEMATWSAGSLYAANDPEAATIREMCIKSEAFSSLPFAGSFYGWLTFSWGELLIPFVVDANHENVQWSQNAYHALDVKPYAYSSISGTHQAIDAYSTHQVLAPGASFNMNVSGGAQDTLLWASWPVELTTPAVYEVVANLTSTNTASVDLDLVNPANNQIVASFRSKDIWAPNGNTKFGVFNLLNVPAGKYVLKFSNHVAWSEMVLSSITLTEADLTVAGSSEAVFGTAWDELNTDNDMVLNAGVYTFTKENVLLAAGTIELKVVVNHDWGVAFPASNYELSIPEGGNYNITVTYNPEGNVVAAVASLITPVVVLPTVSIAGRFNSWSPSANVLVESLDHLTCSGTISLTPGWYEFKVVSDGSWLSDGPGESEAGDLHQMSRRYYSKLGLTTGRKNLLLLADVAGNYEFVYTYATHDLVISVPDFVREAANTNYQSLCTPFDATIEGATAYEFAGVSASGVSINQVTNLIAGHSYIIKPTAVGDININYVADGDVTLNAVQPNGTGLYGHLGDPWTYDYEAQTTWRNNYVLLDDDKFHEIQGGTVTFNHTRAYLHVEGGEPAPALRIIETATNIENIEGNETAVKFIENGKLFIKKNGVVYDATGREVR